LAAIETTMASFRKLPLAIRIADHSPSPTSIHLAVSFDQTRKCIGRLRNEAKVYGLRVIPKPNPICAGVDPQILRSSRAGAIARGFEHGLQRLRSLTRRSLARSPKRTSDNAGGLGDSEST
jgi:hypothetical protein